MDALPFCRATLYGVRCPQGPYFINTKRYPLEPRSIGEAIRKRRLDLNLRQVDAAKAIGCNEMSIVNWEMGHTRPSRRKHSAIRTFLGPSAKEWQVWFEGGFELSCPRPFLISKGDSLEVRPGKLR